MGILQNCKCNDTFSEYSQRSSNPLYDQYPTHNTPPITISPVLTPNPKPASNFELETALTNYHSTTSTSTVTNNNNNATSKPKPNKSTFNKDTNIISPSPTPFNAYIIKANLPIKRLLHQQTFQHKSPSFQQQSHPPPSLVDPFLDYQTSLFMYINAIRTKPKEYTSIINTYQSLIKYDNKGAYIYIKNKTLTRIALYQGTHAFKSAVFQLSNINTLLPFEYDDKLCMAISSDKSLWNSSKHLGTMLIAKSKEMGKKYKKYGINFVMDCVDGELSSLIQIVDDDYRTCGQRKSNVLSKEYTHIGISFLESENNAVTYVTFAG